jgi:tetratricopeptide (TPR) repeat protein
VAIDRDATLRKAEKFLRQGRLDQAIAEYLHVIAEQPRDWSTVNAVGDLLVRAGQVESAIEHYTRIADHFFEEGFLPRAAAVYKKILKLKPDEEHAALRAAEIAERQGLMADAKATLANVADRRLKRGDKRGAAEIQLRIGALDPNDLNAGITAAKAAYELGDVAGALQRLIQLSADFQQRGRMPESLRALEEALSVAPDNVEVRSALVERCLAAGEIERAITYATAAREFKAIAAELYARGQANEALVALERALQEDPEDNDTRGQLARSYIASGDLEKARACLSGDIVDPELLLSLAEVDLRGGRLDDGRALAAKVLERDPTRREEVVLLGCRLCEENSDAAFQCIDVATDAGVADSDWPAAASALHEYVTRVPGHIPALMKLVEICVDGGLDATMYAAQAQLADAYLKAGRGNEARVIAEDLVAREPWESANIERFRSALVMLGEPEPDSIIADRLSGDSPFTSTDFAMDSNPGEATAPEAPVAKMTEAAPPPAKARSKARAADGRAPLGPAEIDLTTIFGVDSNEHGGGDVMEIDLSDAMGDISFDISPPAGGATRSGPVERQNLERVFEGFRDDAARQGGDPGQQYRLALAYRDAGDLEAAIRTLEGVVRSPRHRFDASAMLARLHRDSGHVHDAIDWFERAAESAPAATDASHEVLYELGALLIEAGEIVRALAVFLELQADAPDYRDVAAQVERLSQKA